MTRAERARALAAQPSLKMVTAVEKARAHVAEGHKVLVFCR